MNGDAMVRLSLGPVPFHWARADLVNFYREIADTAVDVVYLGETVCSKRRALSHADWLAIAEDLSGAGKEVVLSTLALVEAGSELGYVRRLCDNGDYLVEANDLSAVQMLAGRTPFVGGPTLNVQNPRALARLAKLGMRRWVAPVEATRDVVSGLRRTAADGLEFEALGWGLMPLSYSARCFTARAHGVTKDDCGNCCMDYPDGLPLSTQDGDKFLLINGIQTMSSRSLCLAGELLAGHADVDIVRLNPELRGTADVIAIFDELRRGQRGATGAELALGRYANGGLCNGYWHGTAGMHNP